MMRPIVSLSLVLRNKWTPSPRSCPKADRACCSRQLFRAVSGTSPWRESKTIKCSRSTRTRASLMISRSTSSWLEALRSLRVFYSLCRRYLRKQAMPLIKPSSSPLQGITLNSYMSLLRQLGSSRPIFLVLWIKNQEKKDSFNSARRSSTS